MENRNADSRLNLLLTLRAGNQALEDFLYNANPESYELIVKYNPLAEPFTSPYMISFTPLISDFAIINIMPQGVSELLNSTYVEYVELPKEMFYQLNNALSASCIKSAGNPSFQSSVDTETGDGILIAVIDSGIDYTHPDFINEDGTTRILALWDQTLPVNDSSGKYKLGQIFSSEEINLAISENSRTIVPSYDVSGHGTHVAGICAGNGRASLGRYTGVAPGSTLLIIKLGSFANSRTALTSHLMMALDYAVNEAQKRAMPLAINLSYGENFGPHDGLGLLDHFIGEAALIGRTCICIGTGNEGANNRHSSVILQNDKEKIIEMNIAAYESSLSLQLWKNFYDEIGMEFMSSEGYSTGVLTVPDRTTTLSLELGNLNLFIYFGLPTPFTIKQEIFFYALPKKSTMNSPADFLPDGIWTLRLYGRKIRTGEIDMWLPSASSLSATTRFLIADENTTLTIPSTAPAAISVGGYDSNSFSYAPFSGRGFTKGPAFIKPELCAPAVNIVSAAPGGGYVSRTGTSMAVPFVTGSCARLMEWGIKKGNDPYLYGERAKAFLINGTRTLPAYKQYPNPSIGYGILCLENSY